MKQDKTGFLRIKATLPSESVVYLGRYASYRKGKKNPIILIAPDDDALEMFWNKVADIPLDRSVIQDVAVARRRDLCETEHDD